VGGGRVGRKVYRLHVTATLFIVRKRLDEPPVGETGKEVTWKT
jgi:hypothetical protein